MTFQQTLVILCCLYALVLFVLVYILDNKVHKLEHENRRLKAERDEYYHRYCNLANK